ncbi:MAG: OsmC family protein [Bacteroidota bacterium]
MKQHHYNAIIKWTGNLGKGTEDYTAYSRDHQVNIDGKYAELLCASDPAFRGDPSRYNPEELFLSSISTCHMLWYLHLCAKHGIVVTSYTDEASGAMEESVDGSGQFTSVVLHPKVSITDKDKKVEAIELHETANGMCFIANSCNFPIQHQPTISTSNA